MGDDIFLDFCIFVLIGFVFHLFGMPGYDLLFRVLRPSIIGAKDFNGRVRDGIVF